MQTRSLAGQRAFTLIELLVVIAIISLLIAIILPAVGTARRQGQATKCLSNLHILGQGLVMYTNEYKDAMVPSRLPKWPGFKCDPWAELYGQRKFRPTFVAMMSVSVGVPPFADPQACGNTYDKFGEKGDRQNYSYPLYVCPSVPNWTDERNGSYGYNYHFLGNSRLLDENLHHSYKNWPVQLTKIRNPASTVAVADGMGTAASFKPTEREEYLNNSGSDDPFQGRRYGNEGFNLDPPRVVAEGEMADVESLHRSAADPRHNGRASVLWVDGHVTSETLRQLGYQVHPDGHIELDGDDASNIKWTGNGNDVPWTPGWLP